MPGKTAILGGMDLVLLAYVLLLLAVGLTMLLSASYPSAYYEMGDPTYYFKRQGAFALAGVLVMLGIGRKDYSWLRRVA